MNIKNFFSQYYFFPLRILQIIFWDYISSRSLSLSLSILLKLSEMIQLCKVFVIKKCRLTNVYITSDEAR